MSERRRTFIAPMLRELERTDPLVRAAAKRLEALQLGDSLPPAELDAIYGADRQG